MMMIVKRHRAGFFFSFACLFLYLLAKAIGSGQWNTHSPSVDRPFRLKKKERKEKKTREEQMLDSFRHSHLCLMAHYRQRAPTILPRPPVRRGLEALLLLLLVFLFSRRIVIAPVLLRRNCRHLCCLLKH